MIGCNPYNTFTPLSVYGGTTGVTTLAVVGAGAVNSVYGPTGNTTSYRGTSFTQLAGDRSGLSIASVTPANIANAIPYTFCLPLLSGVVGVNASKCYLLDNWPLLLEWNFIYLAMMMLFIMVLRA